MCDTVRDGETCKKERKGDHFQRTAQQVKFYRLET